MSEIFSKILKDKNGKVLNVGSKYKQPEWGAEENGVILPEVTLTEVAEDIGGFAVVSPFTQPIEANRVYIIKYNGVEYPCTAIEMADLGGFVLGNGAAFEVNTPNADAPFMFMALYWDVAQAEGIYAFFIPLDGSESCTISVMGNLMHTIPPEYTASSLYVVGVKHAEDGSYNCTFIVPFSDVLEAIKKGKFIFASNNSLNLPVTSYNDANITFAGFTYLSNKTALLHVYEYHSDGTGRYTEYSVGE